MAQVTCPSCGTAQPLPDPRGYTCASCGLRWEVVTCDDCGARFHMRPGTTAWTCPECGREHGAVQMGYLQPDAEPEPEAGTESVSIARQEAPPGHAMPTRGPARIRDSRGKMAALAVGGIAAVLAVASMLSAFGPRTSTGSTGVPTTTIEALCLHLRDLQTPRETALTRLADTLEQDAATIETEGDPQLAQAVRDMREAVVAYVDVLATKGDISEVAVQVGQAYDALPC